MDGVPEPDEPDWPLDGDPEPELEPELGEPVEPAAAAVGVAVTVTKTVTGEQDGQVGHADAPDWPRAGTPEAAPWGEPLAPACPRAGTGELDGDEPAETGGPTTAEPEAPAWLGLELGVDGDGPAETGGPTTAEPEAPAWLGLGLGLETATTGTTVLRAGQFSTSGPQLVMTRLAVLKAVAITTGADAETCSWI